MNDYRETKMDGRCHDVDGDNITFSDRNYFRLVITGNGPLGGTPLPPSPFFDRVLLLVFMENKQGVSRGLHSDHFKLKMICKK